MENLFAKTFEHAPALALNGVTVFLFLKFLKEMLASHAKRTDEFISEVKQMHAENQADKRDYREALRDNTIATNQMTTAFKSYVERAGRQ